MHVLLDGSDMTVPDPQTLAELLEGIGPQIDPGRMVTLVEVDGALVDVSDGPALAARRLAGTERIAICTEAPGDFARGRRALVADYLRLIAERLRIAADGLAGGETAEANRLLAETSRQLGLVLELDTHLGILDGQGPECGGISEAVKRIGPRLTEAERGKRWDEVAELLSRELVPAIRANV